MSSLSFTKLFSSITDSSVWQESDETRLVWITMLAMADPLGRVFAAVPGLSHRARVSLEATQKALEVFLSPDPYSRSEDHDGRRIEKIAGGWRLLNYAIYREMRDDEARKEQNRLAQQRKRKGVSKDVSNSADSQQVSAKSMTVSNVSNSQPPSAQEEVEEEVEVERTNTNTLASTAIAVPAARGKLVCTLPLNQGEHEVFADDVQQWEALYPAVDVRQELRTIKGWALSNPTRRKTKSGIARFVNSWLARSQNNSHSSGGGNGTFKGKSGHSVSEAKRVIQEIEDSYASGDAWDSEAGEIGQGRLPSVCE